jgi:hypothetical protein
MVDGNKIIIIFYFIYCVCANYVQRYFIFQIRAPGGHDTTFIISTYTINKVKYNNYFITIRAPPRQTPPHNGPAWNHFKLSDPESVNAPLGSGIY